MLFFSLVKLGNTISGSDRPRPPKYWCFPIWIEMVYLFHRESQSQNDQTYFNSDYKRNWFRMCAISTAGPTSTEKTYFCFSVFIWVFQFLSSQHLKRTYHFPNQTLHVYVFRYYSIYLYIFVYLYIHVICIYLYLYVQNQSAFCFISKSPAAFAVWRTKISPGDQSQLASESRGCFGVKSVGSTGGSTENRRNICQSEWLGVENSQKGGDFDVFFFY